MVDKKDLNLYNQIMVAAVTGKCAGVAELADAQASGACGR